MALTAKRRTAQPPPPLPSEQAGAVPVGTWLGRGETVKTGVVWLLRPMPDGQWPPDPRAVRDDSFSWWVRSACGHPGGVKQWAFYSRPDAVVYERVFKDNPCFYTQCSRSKTTDGNRP